MADVKFLKRDNIIVDDDIVTVLGDFKVAKDCCGIIPLTSSPVTYWFYECVHNGQAKFLEQRITETSEGQNVTETIVDYVPIGVAC